MSTIRLQCTNCNTTYTQKLSQHKYQTKKGRLNFCSRSCGTSYYNKNKSKTPQAYDISIHASNRRDEFTGFREFITRINKRAKLNSKFINHLTLQDLKEVWEAQNGICPYTGLKLELPNISKVSKNKLAKASLDRIDSNKGYTKDNVQFMSPYINYLKNDLTQAEFKSILQLIKEHN